MLFTKLWNVAGPFVKPKGITLYLNDPYYKPAGSIRVKISNTQLISEDAGTT
jgi:hypothetical protein